MIAKLYCRSCHTPRVVKFSDVSGRIEEMSSNQCPVCQQEAMDAMTKLMKRPHVCQNCGVELRMNLIYTSVVSIIFFALAVRSLITSGFSAGGMVTVLVSCDDRGIHGGLPVYSPGNQGLDLRDLSQLECR
jgi:hypothetical protein